MSLRKPTSMRPNGGWQSRGLSNKKNTTRSGGPPELVLTRSPILLDGVNTHGPNRTSMRPPNGLGICGAQAPWTTNNWQPIWSARGALLRLTSRPGQNVYICLPASHVLEAYNHKVNHDSHKELSVQECAVLQYAHCPAICEIL